MTTPIRQHPVEIDAHCDALLSNLLFLRNAIEQVERAGGVSDLRPGELASVMYAVLTDFQALWGDLAERTAMDHGKRENATCCISHRQA